MFTPWHEWQPCRICRICILLGTNGNRVSLPPCTRSRCSAWAGRTPSPHTPGPPPALRQPAPPRSFCRLNLEDGGISPPGPTPAADGDRTRRTDGRPAGVTVTVPVTVGGGGDRGGGGGPCGPVSPPRPRAGSTASPAGARAPPAFVTVEPFKLSDRLAHPVEGGRRQRWASSCQVYNGYIYI